MKTTNYLNTFIAVAEDCPVTSGEIPQLKKGEHTVASFEYEMISREPYKYTSDDVLYGVYVHKCKTAGTSPESRETFFEKSMACLRASPLGKRYGWGVHNDPEGKIAIYSVGTPEYEKCVSDSTIAQTKAMRSKRL